MKQIIAGSDSRPQECAARYGIRDADDLLWNLIRIAIPQIEMRLQSLGWNGSLRNSSDRIRVVSSSHEALDDDIVYLVRLHVDDVELDAVLKTSRTVGRDPVTLSKLRIATLTSDSVPSHTFPSRIDTL